MSLLFYLFVWLSRLYYSTDHQERFQGCQKGHRIDFIQLTRAKPQAMQNLVNEKIVKIIHSCKGNKLIDPIFTLPTLQFAINLKLV